PGGTRIVADGGDGALEQLHDHRSDVGHLHVGFVLSGCATGHGADEGDHEERTVPHRMPNGLVTNDFTSSTRSAPKRPMSPNVSTAASPTRPGMSASMTSPTMSLHRSGDVRRWPASMMRSRYSAAVSAPD